LLFIITLQYFIYLFKQHDKLDSTVPYEKKLSALCMMCITSNTVQQGMQPARQLQLVAGCLLYSLSKSTCHHSVCSEMASLAISHWRLWTWHLTNCCGNFTKFTLRGRWEQRWTGSILWSKGQRRSFWQMHV